MLESLKVWLDCVRFAYEVQNVIAMRRVLLARAVPQAGGDARGNSAARHRALAEGEAAIVKALAHGERLMLAAERVYAPVRRWVRADHRRLLGALRSEAGAAGHARGTARPLAADGGRR